WIEVQPSNDLSVNGQTGIMAQPGVGNGQELYMRLPLIGYNDWTTATVVFGAPNEIGIVLYGREIADNHFWDFETGPQGWTHTNGIVFPGGWMVEVSDYELSAMSPEPGDSSMWIDSESYGATSLIDTCYSPAIKTPSEMKWLRWGCGYIHAGNDTFTIGLAICSSGVWIDPIEIRRYDTSIGSDIWDSVDVYAYNYADSVRVFFAYSGNSSYYASFDNIFLYRDISHDVGISDITSPATGLISSGNYDVIAQINNFGDHAETFDITAIVYDTTDSWTQIFNQTITLTDFPSLTDTLHNFGSVSITDDGVFCTEVFTSMDDDYFFNDTMNMISRTRNDLGDVIFEMDAETLCMDNQLLGIEFDGTYFYITGGGNAVDPNKVYVLDTLGNLIWTMDQPAHSTSWGWRDITWDGVYSGPDRIDTLYSSVNDSVDKFGIDLLTGTLNYYGTFPGPQFPNRALAYNPNNDYFYTASFGSDCYKFSKDSINIDQQPNSFAKYGAAYDTDTLYGDLVWWHTQDGAGLHIIQTDADSMYFTGIEFDYVPTIATGSAGGLSFYEGFRGADVLFALVQGNPQNDAIIGIYVRSDLTTGIEDERNTAISNTLLSIPNRIGFGEMSFTVQGNTIVSIIVRNIDGRTIQEFNNVNPGTILRLNGKEMVSGIYFISIKGTDISEKITFFK
ncbi:T9SS type A sorting domain-containing protein, partial [candidate division WOR-3 bacterium]|nr:T9SS type A sorting domain-containing protein [candidate division WOR-3 bacterium]